MTRSMNFDVTATDGAGNTFDGIASSAERLEERLRRLDRMRVEPTAQLNITPATRSAQQLQTRLDALRNVRANVDVTGLVEARRDATALVVELRKIRDVRARVQLDVGTARTDVTAIADRLRALRDARVRVDLDTGSFTRDIARLHQRISALRGERVRILIEVAPPGIREELEGIAAALGRIRNTRARVDVDTGAASAEVRRLGDALAGLGRAGAVSLSIPGLVSTTGQVASLGAAVLDLTGVLGLLPAAGLAAGAAVATLAIGLNGLGDALGPTGTPAQLEKVNQAMARLSPAARELVTQIRALGPAWTDTRLEVQERLLSGVGAEVQRLGTTYLPVLRTGLGGIADELNAGARQWSEWAAQGPQVDSLNTILGNTRTTLRELAPAGTNVAAALTDVAVVGSEIMPELAAGATEATERFREFVAEARRTGELEAWIRGGISTLEQLGRIAGNTGGILGSVFSASEEAGYGFLDAVEQVTAEVDELLSSAQGRAALVELFRESRDVVNELLPGVRDLGGAATETVDAFAGSDGLQRFAATASNLLSVASPLVAELGELAGGTLGALAGGANVAVAALAPMVGLTTGILNGLGPVAPAALAAVVAFRLLGTATPVLASLGAQIASTAALTSTLTAGLTGSVAAGALAQGAVTRLGGAVTMLGRSLPYLGVAAIGAGLAIDALTVSTSDAVAALSQGGQAADDMFATLAQQQSVVQGLGAAIGGLSTAQLLGIGTVQSAIAAYAQQRDSMTALQRAQQDVTIAQNEYQQQLDIFPASSQQVRGALLVLQQAQRDLELQQLAARSATDLHTAAMIQQSDQALGAANSSVAYDRSLISLEQAQQRAAEAAQTHSVDSLELRDANVAVTEAALRAAAAAGEKARADAVATGAANADEIAVRAQRDELIRLAGQASGPTRQALLDAAAAMDRQGGSADLARVQAQAHKDELGRLAGQASGPTAGAVRDLARNFDGLGGAHASAQERARLQEDALRRLAATASGPLRTELLRMADQIRNLPDGDFEVRASGRMAINTRGGLQEFATGGVLPGYTPGRDVHDFRSATGGRLLLSGGEAVMRPEWTRAVGSRWVDGANQAARTGGVPAVADYLRQTMAPAAERGRGEFARGGVLGRTGPTRPRAVQSRPPAQRFAMGGVVRGGIQPYPELARRAHSATMQAAADYMTPIVQRRLRELEAQARAAALGGAAGGAGWQWQMGVLRQRFPGLQLISGFRPGAITATGNRSYHAQGRAVDIPPRMDVFNWIRGVYGGSARELIYSPAGARQVHNGRPHVYTGVTKAMHYDHVHWAHRRGGILPARLADSGGVIRNGQVAVNLSGRAERVLSGRQTESFDRLVGAVTRPATAAAGPAPVALRPVPVGTGRVELGPLLREMAAMRAELRDREPLVLNQTNVSPDPVAAGRSSVLGLRVARGG